MSEVAERANRPVRTPVAKICESASSVFPGVAVAALVAMSAKLLTEHHGGPVMLIALLMGMAVGFLRESPRLRPGLAFTCKTLLRLGVALLGTQITLQYLADLGWGALLFVIFGVCLTIATGVLFARLFGQSAWFGVLMGGAVGICGAAAAAAISAVLPRHEKSNADTAMTIIGVTALSTVAMIAYPIIARSVGLDDRAIGFFLGLTIHDVAQVVGAVVVKLFRVILLLPVVLIVALSVRVAAHRGGSARPAVPLFVIGFALLVFARSFGIIPAEAAVHLSELSRWCLVIAMAAIGISTALGEIRELGYRPAMVLIGATAVIAFFGLAGALSPAVQGR